MGMICFILHINKYGGACSRECPGRNSCGLFDPNQRTVSHFVVDLFLWENKTQASGGLLAWPGTGNDNSSGSWSWSQGFSVEFNAVLCDTQPRPQVKCIKGHNTFQGCEWCEALAKCGDSRSVHTHLGSGKKKRRPKHYSVHHSLLLVSVVLSQFVLDYMHIVWLGHVKRLLPFLICGPHRFKLVLALRQKISNCLHALRAAVPSGHFQQPRLKAQI